MTHAKQPHALCRRSWRRVYAICLGCTLLQVGGCVGQFIPAAFGFIEQLVLANVAGRLF